MEQGKSGDWGWRLGLPSLGRRNFGVTQLWLPGPEGANKKTREETISKAWSERIMGISPQRLLEVRGPEIHRAFPEKKHFYP